MNRFLLITCLLASSNVVAQTQGLEYPRAVVAYLGEELPKMEKAISENDRIFFKERPEKMLRFLESWGLKENPAQIERYPSCTEAVSDYLIVGLCRISPPGSICDPTTFFPKFERNVALCKSAAGG